MGFGGEGAKKYTSSLYLQYSHLPVTGPRPGTPTPLWTLFPNKQSSLSLLSLSTRHVRRTEGGLRRCHATGQLDGSTSIGGCCWPVAMLQLLAELMRRALAELSRL